jgi:predicted secreted protein
MAKRVGHDVVLQWDRAGGTVYSTIAQIVDISGPSMSRNAIDATTRDSTEYWREFLKGFKDAGEITFNLMYDPALAGHSGTAGILADFYADSTIPAWRMQLPGSRNYTFRGFSTAFEVGAPLDDALAVDLTVKVTGKVTIS